EQVAVVPDAAGRHRGPDLGDIRVDHGPAGGNRDRHPVMPILDEMQVGDAIDLDRRDRLASPLSQSEPFPAFPYPAGGRPELAVEIPPGVHGADDGVKLDRLQPERTLTLPAQGRDD